MEILKNESGFATGVFIPINEWKNIKTIYPDIDSIDYIIPDWQKKILDFRLEDIEKNPESLRPISELFEILDREV